MVDGTTPCDVPDRDLEEGDRGRHFYVDEYGDPPQSASPSRESNDDVLVFL